MTITWEKKFDYRYRHYVRACSCGPLVYLATLKCASTFFYYNLVRNYKWDEISFANINWASQRVFSHIMEPFDRRHKGVAEYLCMTNTNDLWYSNPNFQRMINGAVMLDEHSMSYADYYGHYVWMIDWIPLNSDHATVLEFTKRLMSSYGIKLLDKWDMNLVHQGTKEKKQLALDLKQSWENNSELGHSVKVYLERDLNLYHNVVKNFNTFGDTWNQISWFKDREVYY